MTATDSPTPAERFDYLRTDALRKITSDTALLYRVLGQIEEDAKAARAAITTGRQVQGTGIGFGPIGHQAPFEAAQYTDRVNTALNAAMLLGIPADEITAAYLAATTY